MTMPLLLPVHFNTHQRWILTVIPAPYSLVLTRLLFLRLRFESLVHNLKLNRGPSDFTAATLTRGAWSLLQARYCDAPETVFGYTLSGRNAPVPGVEDIVGPVIATVPIKAQVDAAQPVTEFLQRIQSHTVDMTPAQNFALQNIARISKSAAAACNFQTLIVI